MNELNPVPRFGQSLGMDQSQVALLQRLWCGVGVEASKSYRAWDVATGSNPRQVCTQLLYRSDILTFFHEGEVQCPAIYPVTPLAASLFSLSRKSLYVFLTLIYAA